MGVWDIKEGVKWAFSVPHPPPPPHIVPVPTNYGFSLDVVLSMMHEGGYPPQPDSAAIGSPCEALIVSLLGWRLSIQSRRRQAFNAADNNCPWYYQGSTLSLTSTPKLRQICETSSMVR